MAKQIVSEAIVVPQKLFTTEERLEVPFISDGLLRVNAGQDALYALNDASTLLSISQSLTSIICDERVEGNELIAVGNAIEFLSGAAKAIIDALPHQMPGARA